MSTSQSIISLTDDVDNDGYYNPNEREVLEEPKPTPNAYRKIQWKQGGIIGSGAFGKVSLGLNIDTGELLAVKQVHLSSNDADQAKKDVRTRFIIILSS